MKVKLSPLVRDSIPPLLGIVLCFLCVPKLSAPTALESVASWMPMLWLLALGQLLVIVSGAVDVSVGSILGFSTMALGMFVKAKPDASLLASVGVAMGVGLACGVLNGVITGWLKVPPLVTTIATLALFRGLAFMVSGASTITGSMVPDSITALASSGPKIGSITISWILLIAALTALGMLLGTRTIPLVRGVYALGSNAEGAFRRGISAINVYLLAFGLSGLFAGLAAVAYLSRFAMANPGTAGVGLELSAIAAVVIGGAKLSGGSGHVLPVTLGCLFLSVLNVSLAVIGVGADWQLLVFGLFLLAALGANRAAEKADGTDPAPNQGGSK